MMLDSAFLMRKDQPHLCTGTPPPSTHYNIELPIRSEGMSFTRSTSILHIKVITLGGMIWVSLT